MRTSIAALTVVSLVLVGGVAAAQETSPPTTTASAPTQTPVTTTTQPSTTPVTTTGALTLAAPTSQGSLDLPAPETTTSPINRPLMVTGLLLMGGTYAASAIDAGLSTRSVDNDNLYYPIVGPWMDYAKRGGCPVEGSCAGETGNKTLLILDGVGQGVGAIGIVASLFLPEKSTRNWYLIGDGGFHAAPSRVGTGYGLGAGGVF